MPTRRRQPRTRRASTSSTRPDPVRAYAEAVVAGGIVAGPHVRNACRRHLQDLEHGPARGLRWNLAAAMRAIEFFPDVLRLSGGEFEDLPFHLHASQAFVVGSIFGWVRTDGTRRFRRAYVEQAKGNGKSPLAAGVGLYMLEADGEVRAEVYAAASKRDQAMVLFRDAVFMRDASPMLTKRLTPSGKNPVWQLTNLKTGSFFKPLSSDDSQSGPRPSCGLLDEIHEMKDRTVKSMIERGFKHRKQPLLMMITNSGYDRNSVCWEEHLHAVKVAAGTRTPDDAFTYVGEVIDDITFSYVCAVDKGEDPLEDESCHIKANPLLGVTMQPDNLREAVQKARMLPGDRNDILRLNFCVWTDSETSWMSRPTLEAVLADFDPAAEHKGKALCAGIDLADTQDLVGLGFCVETGTKRVARADGTEVDLPTYDAWVEAFTPDETLRERAERDKAPYDVWKHDGWLQTTPGKHIAHEVVAARVAQVHAFFGIDWLAFDQYCFRAFKALLDDAGVTTRTIWHPQGGQKRARPPENEVEDAKARGLKPDDPHYPQGLWMPGSLRALEELIFDGRIRLRRSPVLISACMSAVIQQDALMGNKWLSKAKATNRIDVLIALLMAIGAATRLKGPAGGGSAFDDIATSRAAAVPAPAVEAPKPEAKSDKIDWVALNDPSHPLFEEMARRFRARQSAGGDEDEDPL